MFPKGTVQISGRRSALLWEKAPGACLHVADCWKGNKEVYYLKIIIIRSKQKAWIEKEPAVFGEEG